MAVEKIDPVGPFDFRRSDQIAAAIYIGFVLGRGFGRFFSYLVVASSLFLTTTGVIFQDIFSVLAGLAFALFVFVVAPALRSNSRNMGIVVTGDSEGLAIETQQVRSVYRWEQMGPSRVFSDRLFVMIDKNCGLVIPKRATDAENFAKLARACGVV